MVSFDPSLALKYGIYGKETAEKMVAALESLSLSVTYNTSNEQFTLTKSH